MKRTVIVTALAVLTLLAVAPLATAHGMKHSSKVKVDLDARAQFQYRVIQHDQHVIRFFKNHRWMMAKFNVLRSTATRELRWHQAQLKWTKRELRETIASIQARERARLRATTDWRTYLLHLVGTEVYKGCALPLIGRESGGGVETWNHGGSGAYGLGQALPASKMAAYGSDYMTNGVTQIKWMNAYVQKFGGWCSANAYQLAHGWY